MHSNNAQVHVQIPAAYFPLGPVAMTASMGFSNSSSGAGSTLPSYHSGSHLHNQSSQHPCSHHSPSSQHSYHDHQHSHNNDHVYHNDMPKVLPIHQVDIYQTPEQPFDSNLMNPIMNRQLNNQHWNNFHQHNSSQHGSYYFNKQQNTIQQHQHQQQTEQQSQQSEQLRSNASTPTPTLASTLSTVSSASTPSLSTLPNGHDYYNRQTSPTVTSGASSSMYNGPTSPDSLTVGSLPSPLTSMSAWTDNGSSMDQELPSQQHQQAQQQHQQHTPAMSPINREHAPLSASPSPEDDRSSYCLTQNASHLYNPQDQPQQQQAWVASMATNDIRSQQEMFEQDRQPQQHYQRSYPQASKSYGHNHQTSIASQQSNLPALAPIPLLSPSMLQSDYPLNIDETPTVMSHLDYDRVTPAMAAAGSGNNGGSRYGPMAYQKSRTPSVGSQGEYDNRARAGSVNSTTSSVTSNGVLSSLATTLSATAIGAGLAATHELLEDEDSDSPTTIQMRPRANTMPRKAVAARVFGCSVPGCTKAYTQLHNLKSHERTGHTPIIKLKPFHCIVESCTKSFSQRKSLALHIKTAHVDFKFKPFKCTQPGCNKAYTQLHNLRTHEKTVHLVDLSRKRVKNPGNNNYTSNEQGLTASPGFAPVDVKHGQMVYQHTHMGLAYDPIADMATLNSGHSDDAYHYQRQHEQQESQFHHHHHHHHHHQQYARLSHMNALPSMYDHRP